MNKAAETGSRPHRKLRLLCLHGAGTHSIFSVLAAATVAILSEIVAHDGFGIATDAIRTDALRGAACAVTVLTFGILVKRHR